MGMTPLVNFGFWGDVLAHWTLEEIASLLVLAAIFLCPHFKHRIARVLIVVVADLLLAILLKVIVG